MKINGAMVRFKKYFGLSQAQEKTVKDFNG